MDPSYLKTVSMSALYDTDFETTKRTYRRSALSGNLLVRRFSEVGKSFMMAQLAYHISTGTPLWNYRVRKATVLYFALEDDYPRLQRRLYHCSALTERTTCILQHNAKP
jgi:RecA-family ATPase